MPDNLTAWRQGHVLKIEDAVTLGLIEEGSKNMVVVISHDCDIPSTSEECIELIVGEICIPNKGHRGARHPRILDLMFPNHSENSDASIRLRHSNRHLIKKEQFTFESPDENFVLSADEKRVLKQWLASKYGRPAFPNVFEDRLKAYNGNPKKFKFESELAKILEKCPDSLLGVFFDLGSNRFDDLQEGIPYELSIYIVYDVAEGGADIREAVEAVSSEVEEFFRHYYGTYEQAELIALERCRAVPDTKFSLASLRRMDQWRLEYISLQSEEQGEFLGVVN